MALDLASSCLSFCRVFSSFCPLSWAVRCSCRKALSYHGRVVSCHVVPKNNLVSVNI